MNTQVTKSDEIQLTHTSRINAIDFVRGLIIILMALDHASSYWNSGRIFGEFWYWSRPDPMPDLLQFLVRFVSHWCAPSFVFLAGTSVILYESNRLKKGAPQNEITKHLVIRGLLLLLIEWTLIVWLFEGGMLYFGVLAAIGVGLIVFAFARKLNTKILLGFSLVLLLEPIFAEFVWNPIFQPGYHPTSVSIFYIGELMDPILAPYPQILNWVKAVTYFPAWPYGIYPLDPWLGVMGLGLVFGRWLLKQQQVNKSNQEIAKKLGLTGALTLLVFFIVRTLQGLPTSYFSLWVSDGVMIDNAFSFQNYFWLSKYPPSVVFLLWTLGGMCLALALAFYLQENIKFQKWTKFISIFGSAALFFYCAHLVIYGALPITLEMIKQFSIQITLIVWILGLLILYPLCIQFKQLKKTNPQSFLKYI
ncbi:MAG: DUF1624 domain-containing protein [Candidatus Hodarchaeales archaeon]